jgi:hypothetical protein
MRKSYPAHLISQIIPKAMFQDKASDFRKPASVCNNFITLMKKWGKKAFHSQVKHMTIKLLEEARYAI